MKKVLIYSILVISVLILLLSQFGVQIGNVRIGKQIDLKISQKNDFQNSNFYTKYFERNKLICLNTWATWCVPCIDEIPNLNKLKNDYANKDIAFLSLSIDDDSLKLRKFLDKKTFNFEDITFNNLSYRDAILNTIEEKKIDAYIPSKSVPNTYFIKNKKVIKKFEGEVDTTELKNFINENL